MVERVLAYDDTSIEIKDKEATSASPRVFWRGYGWPLLSYGAPVLRVQNLRGFILRWQEQKLNLDFDAQHRCYFFSVDDSLKAFVGEIQRELPETGYEPEQLWISALLPTWEQRFEQLRQLPENWDSYGASRISSNAIEKGKSILTVMTSIGLPQQFFVAPSPDGGIQIEWELPGKELLLEIPPTGEPVRYLLVETTPTGEELEIEGTIPEREGLEQLLQRIGV